MGVDEGDVGVRSETETLRLLVAELRKERDLLADDLQVKTQMVVALANSYHTTKRALDSARAASSSKDEQLVTNVSEVTSLRQQLQQQTGKAAAAERRCKDLEAEAEAAKHAASEAEKRASGLAATEQEAQRLREEKAEMERTMDDWKGKVKEALKENRKKEQQHVQTEIEQGRTIKKLQELVDKLRFDVETAKLRDPANAKPRVDAETQADLAPPAPAAPPLAPGAGTPGRPSTPLPPLMHQDPSARAGTPEHHHPSGAEMAPWASPPPIQPEETAEPPKPLIVTVHYGSSDGWTVDTKLGIKSGEAVKDVIATACERVNSRYGRNLDCASMCLKTHHAKAKRFVVLSEHRELHSFTYFRKCQSDNKPITLHLEPVPANAVFASPGRASGRGPSTSRVRPSM
jgi:hypothetical protein